MPDAWPSRQTQPVLLPPSFCLASVHMPCSERFDSSLSLSAPTCCSPSQTHLPHRTAPWNPFAGRGGVRNGMEARSGGCGQAVSVGCRRHLSLRPRMKHFVSEADRPPEPVEHGLLRRPPTPNSAA
eukprot:701590-Rhodomonas_salina.3